MLLRKGAPKCEGKIAIINIQDQTNLLGDFCHYKYPGRFINILLK